MIVGNSLKVLEAKDQDVQGGTQVEQGNFPAWKSLMKLHIFGVGDTAWTSIENGYIEVIGTLTS